MADETKSAQPHAEEPRGFGEHTRGLAGEYAHEQGWGLDQEQRAKLPAQPGDTDGGTDYDYGARDFGDTPVNTAIEPSDTTQNKPATRTTHNKE